MDIVFKEVKIIDQTSPFHNSIQNILIKDCIIDKIGKSNFKADKVFQRKGLMVSKGWFDMRANFNYPGLEFKEDIESGCKTATVGGFTGIAILPQYRSGCSIQKSN